MKNVKRQLGKSSQEANNILYSMFKSLWSDVRGNAPRKDIKEKSTAEKTSTKNFFSKTHVAEKKKVNLQKLKTFDVVAEPSTNNAQLMYFDYVYDDSSNVVYNNYLEENLNKQISYSEYIAENLDASISYKQYLSEEYMRNGKWYWETTIQDYTKPKSISVITPNNIELNINDIYQGDKIKYTITRVGKDHLLDIRSRVMVHVIERNELYLEIVEIDGKIEQRIHYPETKRVAYELDMFENMILTGKIKLSKKEKEESSTWLFDEPTYFF